MTLIFFEGFDHRQPRGRGGMTVSGDLSFYPGRMGVGYSAGAASGTPTIAIPNPPGMYGNQFIVSFAHMIETSGHPDMALFAYGRINGNWRIWLNAHQLYVGHHSGAEALDFYAEPGKWHRYELEFTDTLGGDCALKIKVDGNLIYQRSNFALHHWINDSTTSMRWQTGKFGSLNYYIDDIYVLTPTGAAPYNASLGDVRVEALYPASNATVATTPVGAATNYEAVNTFPVTETSYNLADADDERDTYNMTQLSVGGAVYAVQQHLYVRKTDAGNSSLKPVMVEGASERVSPAIGLSNTFVHAQGPIQVTAPSGGEWTAEKVHATTYGYEAEIL